MDDRFNRTPLLANEVLIVLPSMLSSEALQAVSSMEKEGGDRVQLIGSAGKCAENGEIENDNDDENGNDDESTLPVIVVVSIECDATITGLYFTAVSSICQEASRNEKACVHLFHHDFICVEVWERSDLENVKFHYLFWYPYPVEGSSYP